MEKNNKIGKDIIDSNHFMSIATSYNNDTWIAPTFYANDKDNYNIYFVSSLYSKHVQHILLNNKVAISIFDSNQKEGVANGIQIWGEATKVDRSNYPDIIKMFCNKLDKPVTVDIIDEKIDEYKNNDRYIFKIDPLEVYIQDTDYFKEYKIDKRIMIDLL